MEIHLGASEINCFCLNINIVILTVNVHFLEKNNLIWGTGNCVLCR